MKLKKLAATLAASFVLVACSDDKAKDAQAEAEQAVQNAMGKAEQVMQERKEFKETIAKPNPPSNLTVTIVEPAKDTASYAERADKLAERVAESSNPRADKKLGTEIRTLLADTVMDQSVTAQQFNALTQKFDATKATAATGIIFNENMARNKENCNRMLSSMPKNGQNPGVTAALLSGCMNKR